MPRPPGRAPHTLQRVLHPVGLNRGTVCVGTTLSLSPTCAARPSRRGLPRELSVWSAMGGGPKVWRVRNNSHLLRKGVLLERTYIHPRRLPLDLGTHVHVRFYSHVLAACTVPCLAVHRPTYTVRRVRRRIPLFRRPITPNESAHPTPWTHSQTHPSRRFRWSI